MMVYCGGGSCAANRQRTMMRQISSFAFSKKRQYTAGGAAGSSDGSGFYSYTAGAVTAAASTLLGVSCLSNEDEDEQHQQQQQESRSDEVNHSILSHYNPLSFSSLLYSSAFTPPTTTQCDGSFLHRISGFLPRRSNAIDYSLDDSSTATRERPKTLEGNFIVDWKNPIGEGSFGSVYQAKDRWTGETVAVKKITKKSAEGDESFEREMDALEYIREHDGHPNIVGLRAKYDQGDYHYIVLDMVGGGEMFDALATHGPYSEADAARLIREVASALAFLHGLNVVHGDLKPENLMLSSDKPTAATVKLVDFGSSSVYKDGDRSNEDKKLYMAAATPAYSPPEYLDPDNAEKPVDPTFDMWALGVIVYIMLTGVHPFDLYGNASDEDVEREIRSGIKPPTRRSPLTAHLSGHAIKLLERLLEWEPEKRMSALELLENPWVQGKTARQQKMVDSDKRLSSIRTFKTKLEAKVFADFVTSSGPTQHNDNGIQKRTSLIERAFHELDQENRGYVTTKDLRRLTRMPGTEGREDDGGKLSLSGFSDLLSDSMKNKYFSKGQIVYRENDEGHSMYFINSGKISVETSTGSTVTRGPGDFFGEGALLDSKSLRSATITCITPVHAIEISREYFEKYMKGSDQGLYLELKEKDKIRKRNRSKMILRAQNNLKERAFKKGEALFTEGDDHDDSLFMVEDGNVDVIVGDRNVFTAGKGNLCGEYTPIMGRPRNCTAVCASDSCKVYEMTGSDFRALLELSPDMKTSLKDLCLRRDFKKAVVKRIKKEFPYQNPREAFDAVKTNNQCDALTTKEITDLMLELNPKYSQEEINEVLEAIKLTSSGNMSYNEFEKVFIANIKTSASI